MVSEQKKTMSSSFDMVIIVFILKTVNIKIFILKIFYLYHKGDVFILNTLNKIIDLLKSQGKKQKDLTDYLGLGKNTFTSWKSGLNNSYLKHISKIADFLNVSVDYLLGKEKNADSSDETLMFALYGEDNKDITPEMLDDIRAFAQFVREKRKKEK